MPRRVHVAILVATLQSCVARQRSSPDPLQSVLERVAVERVVTLAQTSCPYLDFAEVWMYHM